MWVSIHHSGFCSISRAIYGVAIYIYISTDVGTWMQHETVWAIETTFVQDLFCQAGAVGLWKGCVCCVWFCTRSFSWNHHSISMRFDRQIEGKSVWSIPSGMIPTCMFAADLIHQSEVFMPWNWHILTYFKQQYGCTQSINGTRSIYQILHNNLSYGRFSKSNSSVYRYIPVDSIPVHSHVQSNISR